jgi:hypothetical protein
VVVVLLLPPGGRRRAGADAVEAEGGVSWEVELGEGGGGRAVGVGGGGRCGVGGGEAVGGEVHFFDGDPALLVVGGLGGLSGGGLRVVVR